MSISGSVTYWLKELKEGEGAAGEAAMAKLCHRYWDILVGLARKKLAGFPKRAADEEDVVLEAFLDFHKRFKTGRVQIDNRKQLLACLAVLTASRAVNQIKHERRVKRGKGRVRGDSALDALAGSGSDVGGLGQVSDSGDSPAEQAIANDLYHHFVDNLPKGLQEVAAMYLAGCSASEIAKANGYAKRTAERRIRMVLDEWQKMAADSLGDNI